ncbi:hypothetical protein Mgra_00003808 [Meloidogyne graminicola]|uniref:Uncharacterized protein n=1 Tax=Meloidogyne graminicola TaxID=189291 RepID=A0A8S9ZTN7_9BILA|nr:hypothetical protein Mgra_00003808 [Meloidogyne graminicola]
MYFLSLFFQLILLKIILTFNVECGDTNQKFKNKGSSSLNDKEKNFEEFSRIINQINPIISKMSEKEKYAFKNYIEQEKMKAENSVNYGTNFMKHYYGKGGNNSNGQLKNDEQKLFQEQHNDFFNYKNIIPQHQQHQFKNKQQVHGQARPIYIGESSSSVIDKKQKVQKPNLSTTKYLEEENVDFDDNLQELLDEFQNNDIHNLDQFLPHNESSDYSKHFYNNYF